MGETEVDASLDAWSELVTEEGYEVEDGDGARRVGPEGNYTYIDWLGNSEHAVNLMFCTVLDDGAGEDADTRAWCETLNRDAGLSRFIAFPGGDVAVACCLTLPALPGSNATAMYLAAVAVENQRRMRDVFLGSGPAGLAEAMVGVHPMAIDDAAIAGDAHGDLIDALCQAVDSRLGDGRADQRNAGADFSWTVDAEGSAATCLGQIRIVEHPLWGPAIDRTLLVVVPPARQHLELVAALNRAREPGHTGAGAWSLPASRPLHRLTVPLDVLTLALELSDDPIDSEWLPYWVIDTALSEAELAVPMLASPAESLAAVRHVIAQKLASFSIDDLPESGPNATQD